MPFSAFKKTIDIRSFLMKKVILFIFVVLIIQSTTFSQTTYQVDTIDDGITKSIRLKIPEGVNEVEGILIKGNPWQGGVLDYVDDSVANAFASSINFAVMATSLWGRFKINEEFELFEFCIDSLAQMSEHPEISDAPFIFFGCSNGGQMAHSYNSLRPEKCIAFLVDKGGYYINPIPDTMALLTPGILVAGELDAQYRIDAINDLFYNNRPRGAKWSHILCQGVGHASVDETHYLFLTMAEAAYKLRYPLNQTPVNGPVILRNLNENNGWLSDSTTWESSIISVSDHNDYYGQVDSASWHINKDLAFLYAAHSSYNRLNDSASISTKVADSGDIVTYHFDVGLAWDSIHIFNKSEKVGAYYGGGISSFDFQYTLIEAGFAALFPKVYLTSGDSSVINLDVVFVRGEIKPNSIESDLDQLVSDFTLYPNPSIGLVNIRFKNNELRTIEVLDITGNIISRTSSSSMESQIIIEKKGLFIVRIIQPKGILVEKVIIN